MLKKLTPLFLFVLFVAAACGTTNSTDNSLTDTTNNSSPSTGSKEEKKRELELTNPDSTLQANVQLEEDSFIFIVENTDENELDILFSSSQEFDYIVFDENGKKIKQHSDGMMYTQAIVETTLSSGESLTYTVSADEVKADLPQGTYKVQFLFAGADLPVQASTSFEVN
ncbi:BsuPI-related putative proteinase inhibitor [Sutcliffiella sp. NC1]|uniref:BsuPI-related putative proteinase inhibitor n=1 Tax=Sutcliffiella sp. NC1 TaxID=3004096 RepID=UPI0022DCF49F|nr:BsuPI-related putative proteinase inhibitor [Sutcliffiella sp. NC1]WBL14525.1 BsuPI-related putative proteinase inhibitor [Sutcliffiella sp. NC1]